MKNLGTGITIYGPTDTAIVSFPVNAKNKVSEKIMEDDSVTVNFISDTHISIPLRSYLAYGGRIYFLTETQLPKKSSGSWVYELRFDARHFLSRLIPVVYNGQAEWSLTGNPAAFVAVMVDLMNAFIGSTVWTVGIIEPTEAITLSFNAEFVLGALTRIAQEAKSEWWFDGTTLNLSKCEIGDSIQLASGAALSNIEISDSSEGETFTRLYAFGGTRNIPEGYRAAEDIGEDAVEFDKRLKLPAGTPYIDAWPDMAESDVVPGFKFFDTVYPRKTCTVDDLKVVGPFEDDNKKEYNKYLIHMSDFIWNDDYLTTETLSLTFETGRLAGRTFELKSGATADGLKKAWLDDQFVLWSAETYAYYCTKNSLDPEADESFFAWRQYVSSTDLRLWFEKWAELAAAAWRAGTDSSVFAATSQANYFWSRCASLGEDNTAHAAFCASNKASYLVYFSNWFEIISEWASPYYLPNSILTPEVGDDFTMFNFNIAAVADQFVPDAEAELLAIATDYMAESIRKRKTYECPTRPVYCKNNEIDLPIGKRVRLSDDRIRGGYVDSRIFSFEKKMSNPYDATYVIADTTTYSRLGSIEQSVKEASYQAYLVNTIKTSQGVAVIEIPYNEAGAMMGLKKEVINGVTKLSLKLEPETTETAEAGHLPIELNDYGELYALFDLIKNNPTFLKGFKIGDYIQGLSGANIDKDGNAELKALKIRDLIESPDSTLGAFGSGFKMWMEQGKSHLEIDNLLVRMGAVFNTLTVSELKSSGGQILVSSADMKCIRVEDLESVYRCFFDNDSGNIINQFVVNDQAKCQRFTGAGIKYYWRRVDAIGTDYIDLSKTDADGAGVPERGDSIVQLGHRTLSERQNALLISAYGADAPSLKQYAGIHTYNLEGCETTVISPSGNKIVGNLYIKSGQNTSRVPRDCGAWKENDLYAYYDRVSDGGALWLCVIEEGTTTTQRPGAGGDWEKQVAEGESPVQVTILSSQGNIFKYGIINTVLTAKVYRGGEDITASLSQDAFRWVRTSDNADADAVWNAAYANFGSNVLSISGADVEGKATFNCNVTIPD